MTTELILLLVIFVTVIVGIFKTPTESFQEAGPKLGLRIEKQIETGTEFALRSQKFDNRVEWDKP